MTEMKNTLFRFVTMRAPELINDTDRQHFVRHPSPTDLGHFKDLMETGGDTRASQMAKWKTLANTFAPLLSLKDAKEAAGTPFSNFTAWLAKNAVSISRGSGVIPEALITEPLSGDQKVLLWDNLFYQMATGANSYIRDFCMEALIASHYIENSGQPNAQLNALSRVVIPAEFFGTDSLPQAQPPQLPQQAAGVLQKQLDDFVTRQGIENCTELLNELAALEQQYEKQNHAAYTAARKIYEAEVKTLFTPPAEGGTVSTSPDVPAFEFIPAAQIFEDSLDGKLSYKTRQLAENLNLMSGGVFTYAEAMTMVKQERDRLTGLLFKNNRQTAKSVALKGVLLPVEDEMEMPEALYGYAARTVHQGAGLYSIVMAINTGYAGASAVNAQYSAVLNTGTETGNGYSGYAAGNFLVLQLFPNNLSIPGAHPLFRFHGSVTLNNGTTLLFDFNLALNTVANGIMLVDGAEANPEGEIFVPSGFGIKRLGIADYRLVEQTTCCYVPGEVSHIENVMAREYKEKTSRRLRRSENTVTTERQTEKEDLTDTTTTDRYEMQQQTSEVINSDTQTSFNTNAAFGIGKAGITVGSSFAYNTSQQQSNSQALTYAKDVTQRAQERVVQKVREERVLKIIDEFEEQQKHGFDNRKGDKHVSGVYRWVDKIYKNQVYNYCKRLMYEFMAPQPSVFHNEAMKGIVQAGAATVLEKPADPRKTGLADWRAVNESNAAYWAALYNAEIESLPDEVMAISKSFDMNMGDAAGHNYTGAKSFKLDIPEGYESTQARVSASFQYHPDHDEWSQAHIRIGEGVTSLYQNQPHLSQTIYFAAPIRKEMGVAVQVRDLGGLGISIVAHCRRTPEVYKAWQLATFNAIVTAYEEKLAQYNEAMAAVKETPAVQNANPQFYRQIENTVLRKNCIGYLVGHANLGKNGYTGSGVSGLHPLLNAQTDRYGALAKFMEQAFEWDLISYTFYPFYWAGKQSWQQLYQTETGDPLFRSFLQAGMARVLVTVRPGFEEAVMHYMQTGQVWNGGQTPVIGGDLYLSITEELKNPHYYVEETWETRVPTTLTVIQAGSLGLQTQGLPCCHDNEATGFVQLNDVMEGETDDDNGDGTQESPANPAPGA